MDTWLFIFWPLALLCSSLIQAAPVSENFVVSVSSNVTVHTEQTAILPCWLSPQQSAEEMEVNWFHQQQFDAPVLLYKDKTLNSASQPASYTGRVAFGQKDAFSGGLKDGDVTLQLVNVTFADAGEYTCYVSSDKHHDRASFNLFVTRTGAPPLLTAVVMENNKVNVSCESSGWYPEPKLQWSDGSRTLTSKAPVYSKGSTGLMSVYGWLLVSSSSAVSCSVGLPGEKAIVGRMRVETADLQTQGSVAGWVLFAMAAVALVALLGFLLFKKYKGNGSKSGTANCTEGESEKLLPMVPDDANYVNVQLNTNNNGFLKIAGNKLRDAGEPDGNKIPWQTTVTGTTGFSSGKHCWEVSLVTGADGKVPPKQSWWIGVTNQSKLPNNDSVSPTANNGFWFLSSSLDNPGKVQFSTKPCVSLDVSEILRRIGVFLDYDGGKLEFYNMENGRRIGSFLTEFSGEVFPLFNPGRGDKSPMEIIHKNKDDEPSDTATTNNQTAE